jgi:hypothetical protein
VLGATLYREVRDFAPGDWDSGMLTVAWVVADHANEKTRISTIRQPLLLARTRLELPGLRAAILRLSEDGYEFRRPLKMGRDGRPVYSFRGHPPEYQVPLMAEHGAFVAYDADDPEQACSPVDRPP